MTVTIREMGQPDVAQVYDCMVALFNESAQSEQEIDFAKGLKHLYDHVDSPWDRRKIFIAVDGDKVVGMIKCFISEYWYSNDLRAVHEILYVVPEMRKSSVAQQLFTAYEEWARSMKAIHCAASIFVPSLDAQATFHKLMVSMSYKHAGTLYKKDLS